MATGIITARSIENYARMIAGARNFILTPYAYPVEVPALALNQSAQFVLNATANADFIFTAYSDLLISDFVTVLIEDMASNERYTSAPVYGTFYNRQSTFAVPRYISGKSNVTFIFQNTGLFATDAFSGVAEGVLIRFY